MGVEAIDDCEHIFANDPSGAIAGLGAAVVSWCVMVERALWMIWKPLRGAHWRNHNGPPQTTPRREKRRRMWCARCSR